MSKQLRKGRMVVNKNRVLIGIMFFLSAIAVAVYLFPHYISSRQIEYPILTLTRDIAPGMVLSKSDVAISKTSDKSLTEIAYTDPESVIGKTAARQLSVDRYLFLEDVAENYTIPTIYNTLPEGYLLLSISTQSLAYSVAGQIRADDIIRFYSLDESGKASTPIELQYVKVMSVYDSQGFELFARSTATDASHSSTGDRLLSGNIQIGSKTAPNDTSESGHQVPAFVSLLVTQKQALKLVELERKGGHYISLVSRDNEELEKKMLERQASILEGRWEEVNG